MAKQLRELLTDLRAELGHSTNVAHGINDRDTLIYYINRTQNRLIEDFDWPFLYTSRDVLLTPGQRYYSYPADMGFGDINRAFFCQPNPMHELLYGVGPGELALYNSEQSATSWPPRRWMHYSELDQYEVWPVPNGSAAASAFVQFWGTRAIAPMVNDGDLSTLPDNLVTLYAAAELLARDGAKDASLKLTQANEAMRRHRVRQSHAAPFVIGGSGGDASTYGGGCRQPVLGLDYIPNGYGRGP